MYLLIKNMLRNKSVMIGISLVWIIILTALFAPVITPYDPYKMNMSIRLYAPDSAHWFGTDQFGRDLLSQIIYGARVSLLVGVISVSLATVVGVFLGLVAGYYRGSIEKTIMIIVDIFLSFPVLLLAIAMVAALGPSIVNVMIALGCVYWTRYARVVRSSVLAIKEEEYIQSAVTLGASDFRIILKYILPNALSPIIVMATLGMGEAILAEAALSFLGLGIQPPETSWGKTLSFGLRYIRNAPHLSIFPGIAIMLTVLGFNLLGDGLRDVTDPKLSRK